jgi:hypothetical protein
MKKRLEKVLTYKCGDDIILFVASHNSATTKNAESLENKGLQ